MTEKGESAGERAAAETREKFKDKLREIFRLDCADLDFGVYRVMKMKAAVIEERLIKGADTLVADALGEEQEAARKSIRRNWESAKAEVRENLGGKALDSAENLRAEFRETPVGIRYLLASRAANAVLANSESEADLLNHLLRFFSRYYNDGDFMPTRRGGRRGCYLSAHNGEDVLLHWANRGQYYIKSALQFSTYAFAVGSAARVRFVVCAARGMPKDNNKGGRRLFFPQMARAVFDDAGVLTIPLEYRPAENGDNLPGKNGGQQEEINDRAQKEAEKIIAKRAQFAAVVQPQKAEGKDKAESPLQKHLRQYARGNESDFFVHKDLGGFLSRELDLYIKNEAMDINAPEDEGGVMRQFLAAKVLKKSGGEIITFLAQLEDFQKTLWEKRKFVTETNYVARLGAIDSAARGSVDKQIAINEGQWQEWEKLNLLGGNAEKLLGKNSGKARMDFLANNPSLPLDTAHFDDAFKLELLGAFDDIDENTDGVLINGDNFHALNLLGEKYRGKVKCVYIDPPYNTAASAILYKNEYKDSSWLTMMENRLALARPLLSLDGVLCCAIDDEEAWRLRGLMLEMFDNELGVAAVRSNPVGRKSTGKLSPSHEYAFFYGREESAPDTLQKTEKQLSRYPLSDEKGSYAWLTLIRQGADDKREDSPTMFYPIYVRGDSFRIPKMEWNDDRGEYDILDKPQKGEEVLLPVKDGVEKRWHRGWERIRSEPEEYRVHRNGNGNGNGISIQFKTRIDEGAMPQTWWGENKYASSNHGALMLKNLFADKPFDFPKALGLVEDCIRASGGNESGAFVVDFFAGSGTTAHAVINLNREDGGRRKFILAEMGGHFDAVLLPRVKKLIFAPKWKDGKPQNGNGEMFGGKGEARLVKYHRLESYEDSLDNIRFDEEDPALFGKNYQPRYMLQWESKECATFAAAAHLDSPFNYKLRRAGEETPMLADLPETFCYLAGMHLKTRRQCERKGQKYQLDHGDIKGAPALIVWRDTTNWTEADYKADAKFIADTVDNLPEGKKPRIIYTNGTNAGKDVKSLNPLFQKQMFARSDG